MKAYDLIEYETLRDRLLRIPVLEHRVFLMLTYAALGRVGEILNGRYSFNPALATIHFADKTTNSGKRLLVISVLTEKVMKIRKVPINRDNEGWLSEPIRDYAIMKNGILFPYSTRWGQKIFGKYFSEYGQHIHLLRGWRASHYRQGKVTGNTIDWAIIAKLGGWTDLKTPQKYYDSTIIEDYEELL